MTLLASGYGLQLLWGALVTVSLTLCALAIGTVLGIAGASAKLSRHRALRAVGGCYTAIVRGIPDLIIIYILYFGGTISLTKLAGRYVEVSEFAAGATALGFVFGAYASEIFRGAIGKVPKGQHEAGHVLGLSTVAAFLLIILPQAWRLALPAFGNQSLILLKQTSLVSVIGLEELARAASVVSGSTREPFTVFAGAAAIYLVLTATGTLLLQYAEARSARKYAGGA